MDPSQYYNYEHPSSRSRSLASTTDPSRYMHPVPQYGNEPAASYQSQQSHYGHHSGHSPRLEYVSEGYSSSYSSQSAMSPVTNSNSYPGAMPHQQSSRPQSMVSSSRSVSNPIPQSYPYGQLPSAGYAAQPSQDPYVRHHTPNGVAYVDGSPPMQYAPYPHNNSLHPSTSHPRRTHPAASPVPIPPASPTGIERYACDRCDKTFSRAHDRKRHFETHHSPQPASHKCPYCRKDFSRADSLKRHCDNGCDKDPSREAS
ncbi:hypothetical protein EIP91_011866 [Steccherinum ochraceum]|uniref:C2H2-type domain-containing protein n=1 Tax=Steccherinum ochraceum TaxID=92696 RepID=A0A4R0RR23_9APHY|nr:hypothetical protein EIP91_011866 [Steccherinum ochraceum]